MRPGRPMPAPLGGRRTHEEIGSVIESGGGFMPGFAHIDKEERAALVSYLSSNRGQAVTATPGGRDVDRPQHR